MAVQPSHWLVTKRNVSLYGEMGTPGQQVQVVVFAETKEEAMAQGAELLGVDVDLVVAKRFVSGAPIGPPS